MSTIKYQEHFYRSLDALFNQLSIDVNDKDIRKFYKTLQSMEELLTSYINSPNIDDGLLKQKLVILEQKIHADSRNKVKPVKFFEDLKINLDIINKLYADIIKKESSQVRERKGLFGKLFSNSKNRKIATIIGIGAASLMPLNASGQNSNSNSIISSRFGIIISEFKGIIKDIERDSSGNILYHDLKISIKKNNDSNFILYNIDGKSDSLRIPAALNVSIIKEENDLKLKIIDTRFTNSIKILPILCTFNKNTFILCTRADRGTTTLENYFKR